MAFNCQKAGRHNHRNDHQSQKGSQEVLVHRMLWRWLITYGITSWGRETKSQQGYSFLFTILK